MACTVQNSISETTMNAMMSDDGKNISNCMEGGLSTDGDDSLPFHESFQNQMLSLKNKRNMSTYADQLPPIVGIPSSIGMEHPYINRSSPSGDGRQREYGKADDDRRPGKRTNSADTDFLRQVAYQSPVMQIEYDGNDREIFQSDDTVIHSDEGYLSNNASVLGENYDEEYMANLYPQQPYQQPNPTTNPAATMTRTYHYSHAHYGASPAFNAYPPPAITQRSPAYPPQPSLHGPAQRSPTYPPPPPPPASRRFQPFSERDPLPLHATNVAYQFRNQAQPSFPLAASAYGTNTDESAPYHTRFSHNQRLTPSIGNFDDGSYRRADTAIPFSQSGRYGSQFMGAPIGTGGRSRLSEPASSEPRGMEPAFPTRAKHMLEPSKEELEAAGNKRAKDALYTWYERLNDLYDYRDKHGDCNVPQQYPENRKLGIWVNKQRMEKKNWDRRYVPDQPASSLTEAKVNRLEQVGFVWAKPKGEESWNHKYHELVEYMKLNNHSNVPTKYTPNPALGRWVSTQRSQYKDFMRGKETKIDQIKIDKLNRLEFTWDMVAKADEDDENLGIARQPTSGSAISRNL